MKRELIDSNIEWLGKIPTNWIVQPLKRVIKERNELNKSEKETFLLSLTIQDGIIPYSEKNGGGNKAKEDISKYKIVKKNDIVINSMNVVVGASGISKYDGLVSPVYYVFSETNKSCGRFYNYLFLNQTFENHLFGLGNGILVKINEDNGKLNTIRKKIPIDKLKNEFVPVPPLEEQIKISNYLDDKVSLIDETIENNKKEIELLKEYKNQRINELVTKGINSNNYKYSGIESIGDIPKDWKVRKLKFVANSISKGNGITREEVHEDGDIQCVRYGEIYTKYNNSFDKTFSKTYINQIISPKYISKGDILFAATGELLEEIGKNIVYLGEEPCIVGGDIIILNHSQEPRYLNYLLNSKSIQEQKSFGKSKLKVVHIYPNEISNIKVILPSLSEQKEIANYLDKMVIQLDKVIVYRNQIIEKLEEYKKSLIYEAVTGKIEV